VAGILAEGASVDSVVVLAVAGSEVSVVVFLAVALFVAVMSPVAIFAVSAGAKWADSAVPSNLAVPTLAACVLVNPAGWV
jgi:hypothetical protein